MRNRYHQFLSRISVSGEFYKTNKFVFGLWLAVTLTFVIQSLITHRYNNYLIFENTFRNFINQRSLYAEYPAYHFDTNHYGPLFSLFIAPFAIFHNALGLFLWDLFNCVILFKAIQSLPIDYREKLQIGYIAIPSLVASMLNQQFNAAAGAFIILSYTLLNKDKGIWSAMFIVLGTFIKLYGIVGLAFFFFVKDKPRFILWLVIWSVIFFSLPALFSSPGFLINSYLDWKISLVQKNITNIVSGDFSAMGFFRKLFNGYDIPNTVFLLAGIIIFLLPYRKIRYYKHPDFQLLILASTLLFPVLFSTGAEDCTYIIAIPGVGIWFILEENKTLKRYLLPAVLIFACDFPLLLFPDLCHRYPMLLSMLSVPFFLVWLRIIYNAGKIGENSANL